MLKILSGSDSEKIGIVCSMLSAVGYTIANCFLRAVADCDPAWVSTVKSLLTILMFSPYLIFVANRGGRLIAGWKAVGILCIAGLIANFGGNVLFQWSLSQIGMAFTIPLCLGALITTAAILGRVWLKESLSGHIVLSIAVLLLAIVVLNIGTWFKPKQDLHAPDHTASTEVLATTTGKIGTETVDAETIGPLPKIRPDMLWKLAIGGLAASLSGMSFATLSVTLRYFMRDHVPLATPMVIVGLIGFFGLGSLSVHNIGWDGIFSTAPTDLILMVLAGVANGLAFLALTKALKLVSVSTVNIVSASQVAMGAVMGVIIFGEALTYFLVAGCLLTMVGFMIRGSGARREAKRDAAKAV